MKEMMAVKMHNKIIAYLREDKKIGIIAINENGMNITIELPEDQVKIGEIIQSVVRGTHPSVVNEQHIKRPVVPRNFFCPVTELACTDDRCTRDECALEKDDEAKYEKAVDRDLDGASLFPCYQAIDIAP
jgi:hypothetical protein